MRFNVELQKRIELKSLFHSLVASRKHLITEARFRAVAKLHTSPQFIRAALDTIGHRGFSFYLSSRLRRHRVEHILCIIAPNTAPMAIRDVFNVIFIQFQSHGQDSRDFILSRLVLIVKSTIEAFGMRFYCASEGILSSVSVEQDAIGRLRICEQTLMLLLLLLTAIFRTILYERSDIVFIHLYTYPYLLTTLYLAPTICS